MLNPSENSENVNQYSKQKETLLSSIDMMKKDYDAQYEKMKAQANLQDVYNTIDEIPYLKESDQIFSRIKTFCDTEGDWKILVSVHNDSIMIYDVPGPNNTSYTDKTHSSKIHKGLVVRNNIIATKNLQRQWRQLYRNVNNKLYVLGAEDIETEYTECN